MSTPRPLPLTAGALLLSGSIHSHTAVRGDVGPDLHPALRRLIHDLPVAQTERFAGWCAETVLISDRLYAADPHAQLSAAAARAELWGGQLTVVWIREEGDPVHGTPYPSCRTCMALVEWFGIEAPAPPPPPLRPTGSSAGSGSSTADLARRWALRLAGYAAPDGRQHHVSTAARDVFARYGGTRAMPTEPGVEVAASGFTIDPIQALHTVRTLADFGAVLGARLTPLGVENDGAALLAIDEHGRVFALDPTAEWWLGDTIDQALNTLYRGTAPARVGEDGRWR